MTIEKFPGAENDHYASKIRRLRKQPAYLVGVVGHLVLACYFVCKAFYVEWPGWSVAVRAIFLFLVVFAVYVFEVR